MTVTHRGILTPRPGISSWAIAPRMLVAESPRDLGLRTAPPPRLVLAVGQPERRWTLRRTFERSRYDVVAEVEGGVAGGRACLEAAREHAADAAVIELDGIDGAGLRLVRELGELVRRQAVVVLTEFTDPLRLEQVLRSGAIGVVLRDAGPRELVAQADSLLSMVLAGEEFPEPA